MTEVELTMHGFGLSPFGGLGMYGHHGLGGLLIPMGFGVLIVLGVVLWFAFSKRDGAHVHAGTYAAQAPVSPSATSVPFVQVDPAEAIARERFSRGEIDRSEYDQIVAALRS